MALQQRKEREEEGGRDMYRKERKAAVSTAACAHGGSNGYRAIDVMLQSSISVFSSNIIITRNFPS